MTLLNSLKIKYKIHEHPPFFTVEEAKKYDSGFSFMRTKSLFLKDENNIFYLITLQAHKRLPISLLRKNLKLKSLKFASSEELFSKLKVKPGSVSIFCIIHSEETVLIIDRQIWETFNAGFHPNDNHSTLEIEKEDLHKFYNHLPNRKEVVVL